MAVLIALALMTGLQGELRERIVGVLGARLRVQARRRASRDIPAEVAKLKQVPRVVGAAPAALGKGLLTAGVDQQAPVTIKGIDPALEVDGHRHPRSRCASGTLEAIRTGPEEMDGIVLGTDLADDARRAGRRHGAAADAGPGPDADWRRCRGRAPSRSSASSASGSSSSTASTRWSICRWRERVFGKDQPDFIQVRLDDMFASQAVAEDIPQRLGDGVRDAGLGADEQVALLGALAREDGDLDHHRADHDGRRRSTSSPRSCCWSWRRAATSRS